MSAFTPAAIGPLGRNARSRRYRVTRALTFVLGVAIASLGSTTAMVAQVNVGDTPELDAVTIEGFDIDLQQLRGTVVLVDFWATWCGPCRAALPFYDSLRVELRAQGFEVIAVSVDEQASLVSEYLRRIPLSFPVVVDVDHTLVAHFAPPTLPTSYLIDRAGVVRHIHSGFVLRDRDRVGALIRALVNDLASVDAVSAGGEREAQR